MDEVLIVAIVFGSMVAIVSMIVNGVMRSKGIARTKQDGAMGVTELEERIRRAVHEANEPLRKEIASLRGAVEEITPAQRRLEGGALHDPGLLAEGRGPRTERGGEGA